VAAGEVARLAQRLHLAIAVGLGAAVLALLSASPLLSRTTGDSRAWAALPWPGSPSHDNLPWVCQSVMLGALIVASPLTLAVCETPTPAWARRLCPLLSVDTPIFVVECRDSSPG